MKCQSQNCSNFVKNYIFVSKKTHAHLQYTFNSCAKFQNECLKTLRGVDYTILLSLKDGRPYLFHSFRNKCFDKISLGNMLYFQNKL